MRRLKGCSGIYVIVHIESGKIYVGSAIDLQSRFNDHRRDLAAKKHHSSKLQNAWNKHGKAAFAFAVIRFCDPERLLAVEQQWIDEFDACGDRGFNITPVAGSRLGLKASDETRAKLSESHKGKSPTAETRAKMSAAMTGFRHTAETRAKMSKSRKGWIPSNETRAKWSAIRKGRKPSDEARAKMSAAQRKNKRRLGHPQTAETRAKISAASKGHIVTAETRIKISIGARAGIAAAKQRRAKFTQLDLFDSLSADSQDETPAA